MDLADAVLTEHALGRLRSRSISIPRVRRALEEAERVVVLRIGRVAVEHLAEGRLLRVIVDVDRTPPEVVTVYQTSRIRRYRSPS